MSNKKLTPAVTFPPRVRLGHDSKSDVNSASKNSYNKDDNGERRIDINMQDALTLFDYLDGKHDVYIKSSVDAMNSGALKGGANVISNISGDMVGSIFDIELLENPRTDIELILKYWRVCGFCPYFIIKNGDRLYIRIIPPTEDLNLQVTHTVYESRIDVRNLPGYINPILEEEKKGHTSNVYASDNMPAGGVVFNKGANNLTEDEKQDRRRKKRKLALAIQILHSGVFVWGERSLPREINGGRVITPLRSLYQEWRTLTLRKFVQLISDRSSSRTHVYIAKTDSSGGNSSGNSGKTNNLGRNPGEQVSINDLMADVLGADMDDMESGGIPGSSRSNEPTERDWQELSAVRERLRHGIYENEKDAIQSSNSATSIDPFKHYLDEGERVVASTAAHAKLEIENDVKQYKAEISAYTGDHSDRAASTVEDARMENQRLHIAHDKIRQTVSSILVYFYSMLYFEDEKRALSDTMIKNGEEKMSDSHKGFIRRRELVRVEFIEIPEMVNLVDVINVRDSNAITDEEFMRIQRNYVGMGGAHPDGKDVPLNRWILPSEQIKQQMKLDSQRLKMDEKKMETDSAFQKDQLKVQKQAIKANAVPSTSTSSSSSTSSSQKAPKRKAPDSAPEKPKTVAKPQHNNKKE